LQCYSSFLILFIINIFILFTNCRVTRDNQEDGINDADQQMVASKGNESPTSFHKLKSVGKEGKNGIDNNKYFNENPIKKESTDRKLSNLHMGTVTEKTILASRIQTSMKP